jgi:hypothetical protein
MNPSLNPSTMHYWKFIWRRVRLYVPRQDDVSKWTRVSPISSSMRMKYNEKKKRERRGRGWGGVYVYIGNDRDTETSKN